ncbi:MAG TPA: cysteine synthase A [Euryarchaeota archaeon]|nr:cysteine synthase A [Euryarchaeota archaeon]
MSRERVYGSILETIGDTPLVKLSSFGPQKGATIVAKIESMNPMSSLKDRIALSMIEDAERRGVLRPGMTVVEPTSGNTGIGLAMVCAVKGYRLILTMPETMSIERRKLLRSLGAQIELTDGKSGMRGTIEAAERILREQGDAFMPDQFKNRANPAIHSLTTAEEILSLVPSPDAFVAGVGTGGTITGVGRLLKERNLGTQVIAVEPEASPVLSGGAPGPHGIQGIGAGFIPEILDRSVIDRVIQVTEGDAVGAARELANKEGILAGPSSGAAAWAAYKVAIEMNSGNTVVVILPDTGERYLSTGLFAHED